MSGAERATLHWLHISDLHVTAGDTYEQDIVLGAFVRSIREGLLKDRPVDLVFCTGDVAANGKPDEYRNAGKLFADLSKALDLKPERFFVVPGNHDVDRSLSALGPQLSSREQSEAFFGNPPLVEAVQQLFHGYRGFHREFFGHAPTGERPYVAHSLHVRDWSVGVIALNDAWRATEDRKKGELVLGERALRSALAEFPSRPDLLIALMHYPLAWLAEFDEEAVVGLLLESCDFVLEGHLHKGRPTIVDAPEGRAAVIGAGALYQTRKWPNVCFLVEIEGAAGRVHALRFKDEGSGRWILDPTYFDKQGGSFLLSLGRPSQRVEPAAVPRSPEISSSYLQRVVRETRCADLLGISTRDDTARLVDRIPLEEIWIPLRTRTPAGPRRRGRKRERASAQGEQTVELVQYATRWPFLALIGEPGSGKSTFLQYLAHFIARVALGDGEARAKFGFSADVPVAIPLRVPLKTLAGFLPEGEIVATSLRDGLAAWAQADLSDISSEQLGEAFSSHRLALLLDGLDEIPDTPLRERMSKAVARAAGALQAKDGPGRIILTSRPRAYAGEARLPEPFAECRILDLSRADVERYLASWVRALHELPAASDPRQDPEAARELDGLLHAVRANVHLRQQTRTPILLTTLALVYHVRGRLPEQRAVLYDEAVDVLLRRFKDHPRWKRAEVRQHLGAIAARLMLACSSDRLREEEEREEVVLGIARRLAALPEDTPPAKVPREKRKEADELLTEEELQAGLLRAPTDRTSRFVHRTFQEFLAAWYFADQFETEVLALFDAHLTEPSWQECLRLIGGVWAKGGSSKIERLLKHLAGDSSRPIEDAAPRIAAAMGLLTDLEQFGLPPHILDPIRALKFEFERLLGDTDTPRDVRIGLAEALGRVGDPRVGWEDDRHFVLVPEGEFWRGGAGKDAFDNEKPMVKVFVSPFRISLFPVTCAQFLEFVEDGGYDEPAFWPEGPLNRAEIEEYADRWRRALHHPVTEVNWFEARAFCLWRNREDPRHDGLEWRLPTEAEWEKAARGGIKLSPGVPNPGPKRSYPWFGAWDRRKANSKVGEAVGSTTPVGCYPAGRGPYGAWDQAGNVLEWCLDWYVASNKSLRARKPVEPTKGNFRVLRGGSWWDSVPRWLRVAYRGFEKPSRRHEYVGFRVVAAPPLP